MILPATIMSGDALQVMRDTIPDKSFQLIVTSPPYFRQRSYLKASHPLKPFEIGREKTYEEYLVKLVAVFRECKRVLKDDGTLWIVIDDKIIKGQPAGIPWRLVFRMQEDGWFFAKDNIWSKPNPTPQSVRKKTTHSHEYVFHFAKSRNYYYDRDPIRTPYAPSTIPRQLRGVSANHKNTNGAPGQSPHSFSKARPNMRAIYNGTEQKDYAPNGAQKPSETKRRVLASLLKYDGANKKSVWIVPKAPYKGQHFATFPPKLIEPIILACSKKGDDVFDPFGGSGCTAEVALKHGRNCTMIDINPEYVPMMKERSSHDNTKNACA